MRHLQPPRSKPAMTDKVPRSGAQPGARPPSAPSSRWLFVVLMTIPGIISCLFRHLGERSSLFGSCNMFDFECKGSQRKQLLVSLATVLCSFLATKSERTLQKPHRLRATSAEALTRLSQTLRMRRRRSSPKHPPVRMDEAQPK